MSTPDRLPTLNHLKSRSSWIGLGIAVLVVIGILVVVSVLWRSVGESDISAAGWLAMGFGILVTLGLGVGLMALVFISNRRGYDEPGGGPDVPWR
jgi:hypothetical protein